MISALNVFTGKENQAERVSRYRNANLKKFYESKIKFLITSKKIPDTILHLVCQDTPYENKALSGWRRRNFINRCVKYYRSRIREIERQESSWFRWLW